MSRDGRYPPRTTATQAVSASIERAQRERIQIAHERKRAYEDCLACEQSLELAGLDGEARIVRAIRIKLYRTDG